MTSKERKLKATLELVSVQGRIDELKRFKSYSNSSSYIRSRLTQLEEKEEKLLDIIEDREKEEVKFVFHLPEDLFKSSKEPKDLIQYLRREFLVRE